MGVGLKKPSICPWVVSRAVTQVREREEPEEDVGLLAERAHGVALPLCLLECLLQLPDFFFFLPDRGWGSREEGG